MARHFLNLAGAATLETESYLLAQRAVADAVDAGAMAVLHGEAGLGKTFAVEDALAAPQLPLLWVSFPSRPTPRLIAATLFEAITGRATRLDRFAIIRALVEHLTATPSIVVDQDAADAILALARAGETASEIYVRIRAALDAFQQAGVKTNLRAVDAVFEHSYGETRPCELNTATAHAAALADQTPDPELAALIAIALLARSPYYLRHANLRGLASDGAILVGPYGGVLAIPPELRRFLATWQHERQRHAGGRPLPLFLGNSHGRISQPAVRRRLTRLDAPASLWEDSPDVGIGEGPSADGRSLLLHLSAWHLWHELEHDAAHG